MHYRKEPGMLGGINRRRFPRVRYETTITVRTKDSSKKITAYTQNISVGGICIVSEEDFGLLRGVSLELDLHDGDASKVKCAGTVVWVVKKEARGPKENVRYDTGIEFLDIDEKSRARINKIVDAELKANP
jgi:Tfp pilus assembly protein PilZ